MIHSEIWGNKSSVVDDFISVSKSLQHHILWMLREYPYQEEAGPLYTKLVHKHPVLIKAAVQTGHLEELDYIKTHYPDIPLDSSMDVLVTMSGGGSSIK